MVSQSKLHVHNTKGKHYQQIKNGGKLWKQQ